MSTRSRLRSVAERLRDAARSLAAVFRPGSTFRYRRTRVGVAGRSVPPIVVTRTDLPAVREAAADLGYAVEGRPVASSWLLRGVDVTWDVHLEGAGASDRPERSGDDEAPRYVLVERIELPARWAWLLAAATLLSFVWIYLPVPLAWAGVTVAGLVGFLVAYLVVPSPLDRYLDDLRDPETTSSTTLDLTDYKTACIGPPVTALLSGLVASGPVFLAGVPLLAGELRTSHWVSMAAVDAWLAVLLLGVAWLLGFWIVGFGAGLLIYRYEDRAGRLRVFPFDYVRRLDVSTPELTGGYLSLLVAALLPVAALTHSSFLLPVTNHLTTGEMSIYFFTPPALVTLSLCVFLYWWVVRNREYVYDRTVTRLRARETARAKALVVVVLSAVSYALAWSLVRYVTKFDAYLVAPIVHGNPLPVIERPFLVAILVVAATPATYLLLGIGYQTIDLGVLLWRTFVRARSAGTTPRVDADLRVLPASTPRAYALSIGVRDVVVVSTGLEARLSAAQFDAIVAHEEAHLDASWCDRRFGDALVAVFVPIAGLLTLTGKNVLFALLAFGDRETAADDYAARHVGPEPLVEALRTLGGETARSRTASVTPFVPTGAAPASVPAARSRSLVSALERYFGLLFGTFAVARAHPDIETRIERLSPAAGDGTAATGDRSSPRPPSGPDRPEPVVDLDTPSRE